MYLILSKDAEQCKHLLTATHFPAASAHIQEMREGLHDIIQALTGCLSTQLIAVACLARLCTQVRTRLMPKCRFDTFCHLPHAFSASPLPP